MNCNTNKIRELKELYINEELHKKNNKKQISKIIKIEKKQMLRIMSKKMKRKKLEIF